MATTNTAIFQAGSFGFVSTPPCEGREGFISAGGRVVAVARPLLRAGYAPSRTGSEDGRASGCGECANLMRVDGARGDQGPEPAVHRDVPCHQVKCGPGPSCPCEGFRVSCCCESSRLGRRSSPGVARGFGIPITRLAGGPGLWGCRASRAPFQLLRLGFPNPKNAPTALGFPACDTIPSDLRGCPQNRSTLCGEGFRRKERIPS